MTVRVDHLQSGAYLVEDLETMDKFACDVNGNEINGVRSLNATQIALATHDDCLCSMKRKKVQQSN